MYSDDEMTDAVSTADENDVTAAASGDHDFGGGDGSDQGVGVAADIDHNLGLNAPDPDSSDASHGSFDATDQSLSGPADGGSTDAALTVSGASGRVDLGAPNLSYDGGEPNAVAVEAVDGSVEAYLDADHNGTVDQVVRIEPDGSFAVWGSDGHTWSAVATGHLDSHGDAVLDPTVNAQVAATEPSALSQAGVAETGAHPQPAAGDTADGRSSAPNEVGAGGDAKATTTPVAFSFSSAVSVLHTAGGEAVPGADVTLGQSAATEYSGQATDPTDQSDATEQVGTAVGQQTETLDPQAHSAEQSPESVMVDVNGQEFDAGPPTVDTDGDGRPDTVEIPGPNDTTLHYQDSNGDGVADKAWATDASGQVTAAYQLGADGQWASVGAGQSGNVESV